MKATVAVNLHRLAHGAGGCGSNLAESRYGETTAEGMASLLTNLPKQCELSEESTFLDIGSGTGRVPLFVRHAAPRIRAAVGIEKVQCRHAMATAKPLPAGLAFLHGDVRALGLQNATHVFMHSTCFREALVREILALARSGRVECIIDYARVQHDGVEFDQEWGPVVHAVAAPADWRRTAVAHVRVRRNASGSRRRFRSLASSSASDMKGAEALGRDYERRRESTSRPNL